MLVFVVKTVAGTTIVCGSDAAGDTPAYGDAAAQAALAAQLASDAGHVEDDWTTAEQSVFGNPGDISIDEDVTIVSGAVVIASLDGKKRKLKKAIDKASRWLIGQGFEEPVTIEAPGTGYAVDDIVTLSGGTSTVAATVKVMSVGGGGEVLTAEPTERGTYTAFPSVPQSTTGGAGSGLTVNAPTDGAQVMGVPHSLSKEAQINWTDRNVNRDNAKYPIDVPSKDDAAYVQLDDAADVVSWCAQASATIQDHVSAGALAKAAITAAADETAAQAAHDADTRKDPWGNSPPDFS